MKNCTMKHFASVCDLELQSTLQQQQMDEQPKRHSLVASLSGLSPRQLQKMALIALVGMTFMVSSLVVTVSTGSDLPHVRIFNGIKSSLGIESSIDIDEKPKVWGRAQQELAQTRADERLREFQRAKMHREFALSFAHYAQQATVPRGLVLPLFDDIAHLGLSVILELRALGMDLPIEIPHCGDFKPEFQLMIQSRDPLVRVYDVCEQALAATNILGPERKLFCGNQRQCYKRFRGFSIKIISVIFSQFQELMLVDADTLFFQNPMKLWDLESYKQTGTLFFHDRISSDNDYLAERVPNSPDDKPISFLHAYLSNFDVAPYQPLANIPRERAAKQSEITHVKLPFEPSDFLLSSHSWNLRAGHEMDSSLLLWNKVKQPRATAILASFLAMNGIPIPPSYGDKELFFIACELAETQYTFSNHGVGSLGTDVREYGGKTNAMLCGGGLHYFPSKNGRSSDAQLLYVNSDDIMLMNVNKDEIYRSVARPAEFYAGSFAERGIQQECPFGIKALPLTAEEKAKITRRQQFHQTVRSWKLTP